MEDSNIPQPYCDPNAYIMKSAEPTKKVVFQEPYECMPHYRVNNNLKKKDCECVNCKEKKEPKASFDLSGFLPMLSSLGGDGIGNIMNLLNGNSSISEIVSSLGKGGGLGNILNSLDISRLFKKSTQQHNTKSTDFCIKDYKRVD